MGFLLLHVFYISGMAFGSSLFFVFFQNSPCFIFKTKVEWIIGNSPAEKDFDMAFAAGNLASNLVGYFVERDYGRPFEYTNNPEKPLFPDMKTGRNTEFPHLVFVGPEGDQMRNALVKKTVAYVITDEYDTGKFKIEKWNIKGHRSYFQK